MTAEALSGGSVWWPYLLVIVFGFLPSEIWRVLAVFLSRGLDEESEVLQWVRAVAITLLAGVIAKLLFSPSGALAVVPMVGRGGAILVGVAAFFATRRAIVGVLAGEAALIALAWWAQTNP
jgi:branched-subunit amino acid transport protein